MPENQDKPAPSTIPAYRELIEISLTEDQKQEIHPVLQEAWRRLSDPGSLAFIIPAQIVIGTDGALVIVRGRLYEGELAEAIHNAFAAVFEKRPGEVQHE